MISKKEYEVLKMYQREEDVNLAKYYGEIVYLNNEKLISNTHYKDGSCKFVITLKGERAVEEYENSFQSQQREEETLKIAEKANAIADKARKSARTSNIISIFACIISLLSILAAVLIGIFF